MKKKKLKKPLIICAGVVLVLLIGMYVIINIYLGKINRSTQIETIPPGEEFFEGDVNAGEDTLNPEDIFWEGGTPYQDENIVNILLIGQDRRPGESRARSDSMILLTINKKTKKIQFTSFMRDMYVRIPGYSDNRINAAYAFGGMELLDRTFEKNFLVEIDGNIEVDFSGFVSVVDKVGGVDLWINEEEAEFLGISSSGEVHMDGEMALKYARVRSIGNSDYDRTGRQRKVLEAFFKKAGSMSKLNLIGVMNEVMPLLTTDLSNSELIGLGINLLEMEMGELGGNRIPVEGGYQPQTIRGMMVLIPDLNKNRNWIYENLYTY